VTLLRALLTHLGTPKGRQSYRQSTAFTECQALDHTTDLYDNFRRQAEILPCFTDHDTEAQGWAKQQGRAICALLGRQGEGLCMAPLCPQRSQHLTCRRRMGWGRGALPPSRPYLSEEGPIEGDSVEAVNRAHVDVQVHEQPLLLLRVHSGPDALQEDCRSGVAGSTHSMTHSLACSGPLHPITGHSEGRATEQATDLQAQPHILQAALSAALRPRHSLAGQSMGRVGPAYLHSHDSATLGMSHLLHHPIGSTAQL
jgi:hypothetical protein